MDAADYDEFVQSTDQYATRQYHERYAIALYGLIGEIGSLISAVKKKILAEGGEAAWDQPNDEIKEELGDVLWYCYSLSQVVNGAAFDILANDISLLRIEISGQNPRAEMIRAALDQNSKDAFLAAAEYFPPDGGYSFDEYQRLAFKTSRTGGRDLLEVGLAVLPQLGAELLRATLPAMERGINKNIADRPANTVLGEVAWHVSAIATLYDLSLDDVVAFNQKKVSFRKKGVPTPLHDEGRELDQQFPRTFEIAFVPVGPGKSRMYFEGRRLGDDLTDNSTEDDGYRFHDVLHLALIAHLGWSPVVRGMMGKKRPDVDEVQDGGRAKVVEELVLKAIHSEGERQAKEAGRCSVEGIVPIFPHRTTITFQLLKTLRTWVEGLEVWDNAYWEWEDAICDGSDAFFQLRKHKQGTVNVDLLERKLKFDPSVCPGVPGITVGLGVGTSAVDSTHEASKALGAGERDWAEGQGRLAETVAAKKALLGALSISEPLDSLWNLLELRVLGSNVISVKALGLVQDRLWAMQVVDYKTAFTTVSGEVMCTLVAIADPGDPSS